MTAKKSAKKGKNSKNQYLSFQGKQDVEPVNEHPGFPSPGRSSGLRL